MASTSISAVTTLITGAAPDSGSCTASGDTCTITGPSGGPIDFNTLAIRVENTGSDATAIATISVSSGYSSLDQGTAAFSISTNSTVIIGGEDFESARFKQVSAQSVILTMTTQSTSANTALTSIEASQAPYSVTG